MDRFMTVKYYYFLILFAGVLVMIGISDGHAQPIELEGEYDNLILAVDDYLIVDFIEITNSFIVPAGATITGDGEALYEINVGEDALVQIGDPDLEEDPVIITEVGSFIFTECTSVEIYNTQANNGGLELGLEWEFFHLISCDVIVVEDVTFTMDDLLCAAVQLRVAGAPNIGNVSRVSMTSNTYTETGLSIAAEEGVLPDGLIISNCTFSGFDGGLRVDCGVDGDVAILNNNFNDNVFGVVVGGNIGAAEVIIRNNLFTETVGDIDPEGEVFGLTAGCALWIRSDANPLICNNAFYDNEGTGLWARITPDDEDWDGEEPLRIFNNTFWNNGSDEDLEEVGDNGPNAVQFDFDGDEEGWEDIVLFSNNIVAGQELEFQVGIDMNIDPGVGGIGYTGLKDNDTNISYTGGTNDNRFAATCVISGVANEDFSLVDEVGPVYDFHLLVDESWDGIDYNNLINSGEFVTAQWSDPQNTADTPDIGMFGGPYADCNIDEDFNILDDYCLVTAMVDLWKVDIYRFLVPINIAFNQVWRVRPGDQAQLMVLEFADDAGVNNAGGFQADSVLFRGVNGVQWDGNAIASTVVLDSTWFDYCTILDAEYGAYLTNVNPTSGDRLSIDHTTFDSCGVGIYANTSRLYLNNSTITGSTGFGSVEGNGIYLTNCSSGKVIIEDCVVSGNASSTTKTGAGIYLSSSSPEIIWTTVQENAGAGISCFSSTPDLDTYLVTDDQPNTIKENGSGTQTGSDGAEIYLASSSYPTVKYNNIMDYDSDPVGYMIYKDEFSNSGSLTAKNNYWGATPDNDFFYWGTGSSIDYSSYSATLLSSVDDFETAMDLWDDGDFEGCAEILEECVYDTGSVGINSVHYLSGCVSEMEDGDFTALRQILLTVASEHQDDRVAKVATRFATDCLTELENYEDALEEYEDVYSNADCLIDSVMAVVDYLAVYELSNGNEINNSGKDVHEMMAHAFAELHNGRGSDSKTIPSEFIVCQAFPNPFNSSVRVNYSLPETGKVKVVIADITGRNIAVLLDSRVMAGHHSVNWEASGVPAGIYFCRINSQDKIAATKLLLVK